MKKHVFMNIKGADSCNLIIVLVLLADITLVSIYMYISFMPCYNLSRGIDLKPQEQLLL